MWYCVGDGIILNSCLSPACAWQADSLMRSLRFPAAYRLQVLKSRRTNGKKFLPIWLPRTHDSQSLVIIRSSRTRKSIPKRLLTPFITASCTRMKKLKWRLRRFNWPTNELMNLNPEKRQAGRGQRDWSFADTDRQSTDRLSRTGWKFPKNFHPLARLRCMSGCTVEATRPQICSSFNNDTPGQDKFSRRARWFCIRSVAIVSATNRLVKSM